MATQDVAPAERTPSPPSAPPTQEYPGHRATTLNNVFQRALTATLRACSYDNFAACFPTPAANCPDSLRELWRQMSTKMETLAKNEYESVLAERNVVPALNTLDRLVAEASRRKTLVKETNGTATEPATPPHMLPPEKIAQAHLRGPLLEARDALQKQLNDAHEENAGLVSSIQGQRAEMARLVAQLERILDDLDGAVTELRVTEDLDLREEAVKMDEAVREASKREQPAG